MIGRYYHGTIFVSFLSSGIWKKLLGIIIFLVLAALVCGLMLPPNSPYVKKKCREGSTDGRLYFKYYPEHSEVR